MEEEEKTHHIVYETTNLINGKKYIGKHTTKNLNDGYLGSGTALLSDIKKYGKKNFQRKVVADFETENEAFSYEANLVNKEIVEDEKYYNMMSGGCGFSSYDIKRMMENPLYSLILSNHSKERWKDKEYREKLRGKISLSVKKLWKNEEYRERQKKSFTEDRLRDMSNNSKKMWKNEEFRKNQIEQIKQRWKNEEYRKKVSVSISNSLKGKYCGEESSFYGKHHTEEAKRKIGDSKRGEKSVTAKLKNEEVIDIKRMLKCGKRGTEIAKIYNVSGQLVCDIKKGRAWSHIEGAEDE
jgi:hypothetical protein